MARKQVICGTLCVKDFSFELFTTKNQVADKVGCGKNYLSDLSQNITFGDYIIFQAPVSKCKRHVTKK